MSGQSKTDKKRKHEQNENSLLDISEQETKKNPNKKKYTNQQPVVNKSNKNEDLEVEEDESLDDLEFEDENGDEMGN